MTDPDGDRFDMMNDGGHQMMGDGGGWVMGDGGGWVMGLVAAVLVLLLVALLAAVAYLAVHASRRSEPGAAPRAQAGPEARLVLDGRLARGEVSVEEYQAVRSLLDAG